ncbi:MAG: hypothetical protein ACYDD1_03560 [Caulobacteraceae bacterium]
MDRIIKVWGTAASYAFGSLLILHGVVSGDPLSLAGGAVLFVNGVVLRFQRIMIGWADRKFLR